MHGTRERIHLIIVRVVSNNQTLYQDLTDCWSAQLKYCFNHTTLCQACSSIWHLVVLLFTVRLIRFPVRSNAQSSRIFCHGFAVCLVCNRLLYFMLRNVMLVTRLIQIFLSIVIGCYATTKFNASFKQVQCGQKRERETVFFSWNYPLENARLCDIVKCPGTNCKTPVLLITIMNSLQNKV